MTAYSISASQFIRADLDLESGHTVGLRHRSTSPSTCMIGASSGPSNPNSVVPSVQNPATDDYTRINLHY